MEALRRIQKELKAPKSQFNSFGKYKYRSCEDILEAVKPLLGSAVLTLIDEIVLVGDRYYVKALATLQDGEERIQVSAFAREEADKKGMDAAQITGACSSYARKTALGGLLLIDDTKDQDTMDNTKQEKKKEEPKEEKKSEKPVFVNTVPKATAVQKIEIRSKMVAAGIEDRAEQMEFYNFVMTSDTQEKAAAFINQFDSALEAFKKSKEA
jgi:hypothetical protein